MSLQLRRPPPVALAIIAGILVLDQLTKAFVVANIDRLPADVLGGIRLEFVRNTGVSFSLFQEHGWLVTLLVCVVVGVVLVLFLTMPRRYSIPLAVLLGGSVANLIDRVRYGYVIDFVALWWWPRFNVADLAIIFGACLTVLTVMFHPALRSEEVPDAGSGSSPAAGASDAGPSAVDGTPEAHRDDGEPAAMVTAPAPDTPCGESGEEGGRPGSPGSRSEGR